MVPYAFLLILVAYLPIGSADQTSPCKAFAYTQAGPVCGLVLKDRLAVFRGIPYGQQPVGKYRFQELRQLKRWKGVLDATKEGPVCPQVDRTWLALQNLTNMNEACIYANIHTPLAALPNTKRNKKGICKETKIAEKKPGLPVLVFVHGGGWQSGSGNSDLYGPEYFVDRDVVVITMNYRQNIFGFMSLNTTEVPGNQGLLDIIHLLRWVRDNVRAFGGDPDNVTLMGESAGSVSVHYVAQSSLSKGLIKRAILSSGAALPSFFTSNPAYASYVSGLMLKQLGINSSDPHAAFQILTELPIETILEAYNVVQDTAGGLITFAPVQESNSIDIPIVGKEEDILKRGANDVPMLIGFNSNECEFFQNRIKELKLIEAVSANSTLLVPPKLLFTLSADKLEKVADEIKQRFFEDDEITYENYITLCNHLYFRYPMIKLAQIRAKTSTVNTYLYQFNYIGEFRPIVRGLSLEPFGGMAHTEDLTYIFRTNSVLNKYPPPPTPVDDSMRASWIDTIVNFMKCSRPDCNPNSTNWPPVSTNRFNYQEIRGPKDYVSSPISEVQMDMIRFFDNLNSLQ